MSGLEHLSGAALRREQERTLAAPRMREFVRECPELEREPFESLVTADDGRFESRADLFRQIGYDERVHTEESLAWMAQPRFA
jgi:hypothetical protein